MTTLICAPPGEEAYIPDFFNRKSVPAISRLLPTSRLPEALGVAVKVMARLAASLAAR